MVPKVPKGLFRGLFRVVVSTRVSTFGSRKFLPSEELTQSPTQSILDSRLSWLPNLRSEAEVEVASKY